jgi:LysM repeat protein
MNSNTRSAEGIRSGHRCDAAICPHFPRANAVLSHSSQSKAPLAPVNVALSGLMLPVDPSSWRRAPVDQRAPVDSVSDLESQLRVSVDRSAPPQRSGRVARPTRAELGGATNRTSNEAHAQRPKQSRIVSSTPLRADRPSRPLTRRARLSAIVCTVVVMFGGYGVANAASESANAKHTYVVQPGDTLWQIARSVRPSGDIRPLVADLAKQHGGSDINVGDVITLPES